MNEQEWYDTESRDPLVTARGIALGLFVAACFWALMIGLALL